MRFDFKKSCHNSDENASGLSTILRKKAVRHLVYFLQSGVGVDYELQVNGPFTVVAGGR